jgi:lactate permease
MWMQEYDPLGSWPISTAAAALPILVLLALLASGCVSAGRSALAGLVSAFLVAFFIFGMPARMVVARLDS